MVISIDELLLFHTIDRNLYRRLVRTSGAHPEAMKHIMALWLWMQQVGLPDVVSHVSSFDDDSLRRVVAEGNACLEVLRRSPDEFPIANNDIPITAALGKKSINLEFFRRNRDLANRGIASVFDEVCRVIFDENLMKTAAERDASEPMKQVEPSGGLMRPFVVLGAPMLVVGSSHKPTTQTPPCDPVKMRMCMRKPSSSTSSLNPEPEVERSLDVNFSRCYPLSKKGIVDFFVLHWGACVEKIMIRKSVTADPVISGRIVFFSSSIIPLVMTGDLWKEFNVRGKSLWVHVLHAPEDLNT